MYSDTKIPLLTSYIETVSTFAKPIFSRSQECWPSLYFLQFLLTSNWHKETLVVRFQNHRANSDKSYFAKFVVFIHHFAQEWGCRAKTNMDTIQEAYKQKCKQPLAWNKSLFPDHSTGLKLFQAHPGPLWCKLHSTNEGTWLLVPNGPNWPCQAAWPSYRSRQKWRHAIVAGAAKCFCHCWM